MTTTLREASRETYTYVTVAHRCGCRYADDYGSETAATAAAESIQRSWLARGRTDVAVRIRKAGTEVTCKRHAVTR